MLHEPYPNLPILPTLYSAPGQAHLVRAEFKVLCSGGFWGGGKLSFLNIFLLIDSALVLHMRIPTEPLDIPLDTNALNGHLLARVEHQTPPLTLLLSGNHSQTLRLHIISLPQAPIVLGRP